MDRSKYKPLTAYQDFMKKSLGEEAYFNLCQEDKNCHLLATPLVEILSIKIEEGQESHIYGRVTVSDRDGKFDIFNRDANNPLNIPYGGPLPLTFPKGRVISPCYEVTVDFDIKDKISNASIAKDVLFWDYKTKGNYDKVITERIGDAFISYITYRYAVIATVEVELVGENDASRVYMDVYGSISIAASCDKTRSSVLFDKARDHSIRVKFGSDISLSKNVVAIPAFSSLVAEAKLWNRDTEQVICSSHTKEINASDYSVRPIKAYVEGNNGRILVKVLWSTLYMQPLPYRNLKRGTEDVLDGENENAKKQKEKDKDLQLHPSQVALPSSSVCGNTDQLSAMMKSPEYFELMEIFSIVICSHGNKDYNLWGTIKLRCDGPEFLIYDRDRMSPERMLPYQTATIKIPTNRSFRCLAFNMAVNLRDDEGREISAGFMNWGGREQERFPLLDRPLCSIIRGDYGYAAIYYTLLSAGLEATVKVELDRASPISSTLPPQVHGTIYAENSKFTYETPDERDHYRSKVFEKDPANRVPLSSNWTVPLLKEVVAVPMRSSLIVDVNLTVTPQIQDNDNVNTGDNLVQAGDTFQGRLDFSTHGGYSGSKRVQKIQRNCEHIVVSVEWK